MRKLKFAGKKPKKRSLMKIFMLLFFGSFFIGVIIMNVFGNYFINEYGVLSEYYLKEFQYGGILKEDLFFYLLKHRLLVFTGILLLMLTIYRKLVAGGFLVIKGFTLGFLLTAGILKYGVNGLILVFVALFPQSVIYYPLYFYMFDFMLTKKGNLFPYVYFEMIFLIGLILETYVNPVCLLYYLSHFW